MSPIIKRLGRSGRPWQSFPLMNIHISEYFSIFRFSKKYSNICTKNQQYFSIKNNILTK
jgi:hypothetical protein